jgi:hypothetical protein
LEAEGTEYSGRGQKIPLTHLNKYFSCTWSRELRHPYFQ